MLGSILFGRGYTVGGGRDGRPGRADPGGRLPGADLGNLKESVFLTARTTAMVCWLFVGSFIFSSVFGYLGGQR